MHPPIFVSGPHGGGKSTLIKSLISSKNNMFIENNFDIDFTTDFPSIANLSSFERSLIRLYHRFFIANYANVIAIKNPIKPAPITSDLILFCIFLFTVTKSKMRTLYLDKCRI